MKQEKLNRLAKEYILDAITSEPDALELIGIVEGTILETNEQKIRYFIDKFLLEMKCHLEHGTIKGVLCSNERELYEYYLEEYLRGLPSSIVIDFTDFNIFKIGCDWGLLTPDNEKKGKDAHINQIHFVTGWWLMIARNILALYDELPKIEKKPILSKIEIAVLNSFFTEYPDASSIYTIYDAIRLNEVTLYFVFEDWDTEFLIDHIDTLLKSLEKAFSAMQLKGVK